MCIYCLLDCRVQCVCVEFSSKVIHYASVCVLFVGFRDVKDLKIELLISTLQRWSDWLF